MLTVAYTCSLLIGIEAPRAGPCFHKCYQPIPKFSPFRGTGLHRTPLLKKKEITTDFPKQGDRESVISSITTAGDSRIKEQIG